MRLKGRYGPRKCGRFLNKRPRTLCRAKQTETGRFLRLPQLMAIVGLRRSAVYSRISDGRMPPPCHRGRAAAKPAEQVREAKPGDKDPYNFSDPESRIMKGSDDRRHSRQPLLYELMLMKHRVARSIPSQ